jgi:hypothetical protein
MHAQLAVLKKKFASLFSSEQKQAMGVVISFVL